jgi:hypothetical protein
MISIVILYMQPREIIGPLYAESRFKDVKDPCVIFDGARWHIYGSGGDVRSEIWMINHAVAPDASENNWRYGLAIFPLNALKKD